MTELRSLAARPIVAALLGLVLLLSGVGRAWTAASDGPEVIPSISGVVAPICHAGPAGGDTGPQRHACCDACALCAVALAGLPDLTSPARVVHRAAHAAVPGWAPALPRPRTPRLAQGPPAA